MNYTFYYDYSEYSMPMCLGEYIRHDGENVIAVTYYIELGRIKLYSVEKDGLNILPILESLEATNRLKDLAEDHQLKLNVKQQFNNYPQLATPMTVDEKMQTLKLK